MTRNLVHKYYNQIFIRLPQPKLQLINIVLYCVIYVIHMVYYKMFKKERSLFNVRFIFDCYITVQYEINGILLSDKAIQNNIENIFTHRFLHFMVEDQYEIRDSEYIPFFALIKGPN